MAEKKSFVMYKQWGAAIEKLSTEQKGILLGTIFAYQSGEPVKIDDVAVAVLFEIMRQSFDSDSEKYMEVSRKRVEAGKAGSSKRWGEKPDQANDDETTCEKDMANANFATLNDSKPIANDSKRISGMTKIADNEYDYDNEYDNDKDKEREERESAAKVKDPSPSSDQICKEIIESYNSIAIRLPRPADLTPSRKRTITEILQTKTIEQIKLAFQKAEDSSFCTGHNKRGWKASFDWIITPDNMTKLIEGNFDDTPEAIRAAPRKGQFGSYTHEDVDWNALERKILQKQKEEDEKATGSDS